MKLAALCTLLNTFFVVALGNTGIENDGLGVPSHLSSEAESNTASDNDAAVQLYRRLLGHKRAEQIEAAKQIVAISSLQKQRDMLKTLFTKLFSVMVHAKVHLMESSFTPGDPFPTENHLKETLSTVLENTAFLGDIVLRLPDIAHELLDNNDDWKLLIQWAIDFTNDTHIFVGKDQQLVSMMAQELGVIDRDPDFINPYKKETQVEQAVDRELERILSEQKRKLQKKERREQKRKQKGPRMSSPARVEL